jgi:hypothetical protein
MKLSVITNHHIAYNDDGSATVTLKTYTTWAGAATRMRSEVKLDVPACTERYDFEGGFER